MNQPTLEDYDNSTVSVGVVAYVGAIATFVIIQIVYGGWLLPISMALIWWFLFTVIGVVILARRRGPYRLLKALGARYPTQRRITFENADCLGNGSLNGHPFSFALISEKRGLFVRIGGSLFARPRTLLIPWNEIEMGQVVSTWSTSIWPHFR